MRTDLSAGSSFSTLASFYTPVDMSEPRALRHPCERMHWVSQTIRSEYKLQSLMLLLLEISDHVGYAL